MDIGNFIAHYAAQQNPVLSALHGLPPGYHPAHMPGAVVAPAGSGGGLVPVQQTLSSFLQNPNGPPPAPHSNGVDGGIHPPGFGPQAPSPNPNGGAPAAPSQDEQNVSAVTQHLLAALQVARDPNLQQSLSTALAALHKHMAGIQKERHDALQGKFSPRLMEQQAVPAKTLAATGHPAEAAQLWTQHHPLAVSQGHIPGYVQQWLAASSAPAPGPSAQ